MARTEYALPPQVSPDTGVPMLNLVRMLSHHPGKDAWLGVGGQLIRHGLLDPVLREIVILRTGRLADCDYEVVQHRAFGAAVGMTPEQIEAAVNGRADAFGEREQLALVMAEELHHPGALSEATFERARSLFTIPQIIELILVVAFYRGTATILRSFDVELDADTAAGAKAAIR